MHTENLMKQYIFVVTFLLIVQLFPILSMRSVVNAESSLWSLTGEYSRNTPAHVPTTSLQTMTVVSEVRATVTETGMPQSTTIVPTQTAIATIVDATQKVAKSPNTPAITELAQSQKSSPLTKPSVLEPVIFVPGIMGSYLDYKGKNGMVCNIWPTQNNDNRAECKELYSLVFKECKSDKPCKRAMMLSSINDPRVYATDVLREQFGGWKNVYDSFLKSLSDEGFTESPIGRQKPALERCEEIKQNVEQRRLRRDQTLLYAFGYDWRQTTETNAATLSKFIDCVRKTHNNAKVSLVGHSMGGLVIKQLLLKHKDSASIARVSTLNTPYLGSVTALYIFGTGEYEGISCFGWSCANNPLIKPKYLKMLAPRLPGAIQLLPSFLYLTQSCPFVSNGKTCTTGEYWKQVVSEFGNQAKQYSLNPEVGRDDTGAIVERTKYIDYLIQFSSTKNNTIAEVRVNKGKWTTRKSFGDETVNEFSLTRRRGKIDYNPQTTSDRKVYIFGYCGQNIGHTKIVDNATAKDRLIKFLRSDPALTTEKKNTCVDGNSINITPPPSTTTSIRPITGVVKSIPRSDDGFSDEGPELGFTVNYYGQTYDYIYVNNNGNVSFNEPVYNYQNDTIRNNSYAMIAGFFADVDTRNSDSKTVQYGQSMVDGRKAFIANFLDVGYNNRKSDKLNRFQIVLIDRSNTGTGNFDIEFNYNKIVWETGDANGGSAGRGGQSAGVGFSSGLGDASYFELLGSSIPGRFLDSNTTTGLVNTSRGSGGVRGRYVITVRNGIAVMPHTP